MSNQDKTKSASEQAEAPQIKTRIKYIKKRQQALETLVRQLTKKDIPTGPESGAVYSFKDKSLVGTNYVSVLTERQFDEPIHIVKDDFMEMDTEVLIKAHDELRFKDFDLAANVPLKPLIDILVIGQKEKADIAEVKVEYKEVWLGLIRKDERTGDKTRIGDYSVPLEKPSYLPTEFTLAINLWLPVLRAFQKFNAKDVDVYRAADRNSPLVKFGGALGTALIARVRNPREEGEKKQ
ncbi:hypothetical protein QP246_02305 [Aerococcus urinae]|uniref:hypothetical protein n=1 Tax=Aerococcus urinae TaxID=1376 RepID=UPI00254EC304|nr:hypothetical protein [Aerococcus urinae]MDK6688291.1 hypothetical protein [Aerococcus urinae]